jgi:hypothetical protein
MAGAWLSHRRHNGGIIIGSSIGMAIIENIVGWRHRRKAQKRNRKRAASLMARKAKSAQMSQAVTAQRGDKPAARWRHGENIKRDDNGQY